MKICGMIAAILIYIPSVCALEASRKPAEFDWVREGQAIYEKLSECLRESVRAVSADALVGCNSKYYSASVSDLRRRKISALLVSELQISKPRECTKNEALKVSPRAGTSALCFTVTIPDTLEKKGHIGFVLESGEMKISEFKY